ncbi:MAG: bifunctional acetate--CoA ligase family protein/GNAT family N-acetyltransferase [Armatimonadetes bacterium]|nr:bifunctional acetate--CoA ligase family protein/GNAT family N-acetyltransferase [Armatimonadota bacterium]
MTTPTQTTDPAHDLLRAATKPALNVFFAPKSVAVIGATETVGSVGRTLVSNLLASPFGGTVYPVNPKRPAVLGVRAYKSVADVPEPVDLAVVCTPAPSVPGIIRECREAGVRGAIIISAGFKEAGAPGIELERQVLAEARQGGMRIVGPNCLGVMSPLTGLNATFAQAMAKPGNVAFLSQSGALLTAVLDHALKEGIGFSAFASLGSMLDVGWGDLLDYLGDDPNTSSIVIYMETVGDARGFLSAAREVALTKPILVIKAGRTDVGAKAAASHTGSLTGSDDVLDAAFDRVGVLRVDSIADVYALTEALAKQPRPRGKRLTIVTNAGGPGVLATDALISGGGELAAISPETMTALDGFLPAHWSHNNPVDVLGDAGAERYAQTLATCADDSESDGLLVVLTPQAMTDPTATAKGLAQYANSLGKPVLASWMGGATVGVGEQVLSGAGIPTFAYPDEAARVFNYLWRYADNLNRLYETPAGTKSDTPANAQTQAASLFDTIEADNRTLLTEYESKQLLTAYEIPTVETRLAGTVEEAVSVAESFGYPVVVKINSRTITHKTDVQGVQLNLKNADAVRGAFAAIVAGVAKAGHAPSEVEGVTVQPMVNLSGYELILGASPDPQFGPVLLFGTGGQLVEVFGDKSLALPPLTTTLARRLMERTKIYTALLGVRGRPPVDMPALETMLVRFAALVQENPRIKEIDLNPLLVDHDKMIALDARVVLYAPGETITQAAIRPYPSQYAGTVTVKGGDALSVRPIRPDDEPRLVAFHQSLSENTVALRYFEPLALDARTAHERLARIAGTDYDREIALVALAGERIVAVARLSKTRGVTVEVRNAARFTLLVSDEYQYRGLGTALLRRLLDVARSENVSEVFADVLAENAAMRRVCEKIGFTLGEPHGTPSVVTATFALS